MVSAQSSTLPADAWLANATGFAGPFIAASGAVFVSNGIDTGVLDIGAGTFDVAVAGAQMTERTDVRRPLEAVALNVGAAAKVAVPDGTQLEIVSATDFVAYALSAPRLATNSRVAGVRGQRGAKFELASYVPGTGWSTIGAAFDEVVPIHVQIVDARSWPELAYCVRTGTLVEYVGLHAGGVTRGTLPFTACNYVAGIRSAHASDTLFVTGTNGDKIGAAFVRGSQVGTVFTDSDTSSVTVSGTTVQAVVATNFNVTPNATRVWVVTSTGSVVELAHSLQNVDVSAAGTTVHVSGIEPVDVATGTAKLIRYREGTGAQTVTLGTTTYNFAPPDVQTTVEGAAIVAGHSASWIVPSTSLTPASSNIEAFGFSGAVVGSSTVVFADDRTTAQTFGSVYVYDELAGARLTPLTADQFSTMGVATLDEPFAPSGPWFVYREEACHLARFTYAGTTPSIQLVDCSLDAAMQVAGRRANGDVVVYNYGFGVWIATATTMTPVAIHLWDQTPFFVRPILDHAVTPPVVVGWTGKDSIGPYACLASHPDRCWTVPESTQVLAASAAANGGDGYFALAGFEQSGGDVTVTIVRTIVRATARSRCSDRVQNGCVAATRVRLVDAPRHALRRGRRPPVHEARRAATGRLVPRQPGSGLHDLRWGRGG